MNTNLNESKVIPFLKWAGGKRWLIAHSDHLIPEFNGTYFEPFLGSGAMFFHLNPTNAVLSDSNSNLIQAYQAIHDDWQKVLNILKVHHRQHSKDYYYKIRASKPRTPHTKAAKFIYLNRTCWNGLYRVNLNGQFNVPIGTKTNVVLETDRFDIISEFLKKSTLLSGDFSKTIEQAGCDDFIFVDPPYTVKHNHNGFVKYNENLFSWNDQERLKDCVDEAVARGAKVLVTNACHDSIKELYQGYTQVEMNRSNLISGKAEFRGRYEELIIFCGYN